MVKYKSDKHIDNWLAKNRTITILEIKYCFLINVKYVYNCEQKIYYKLYHRGANLNDFTSYFGNAL